MDNIPEIISKKLEKITKSNQKVIIEKYNSYGFAGGSMIECNYVFNNINQNEVLENEQEFVEILYELELMTKNKYRFIIQFDENIKLIGEVDTRKNFSITDTHEFLDGNYLTFKDLQDKFKEFNKLGERLSIMPGWNEIYIDFESGTLIQSMLSSGCEGNEYEVLGYINFE